MAPPTPDGRPVPSPPRTLAVCGVKGGVGASMVATNLGIFLAQIGKRVVLADLGRADSGLHAWLGIRRPERALCDVASGGVGSLREAVVETPITGLRLIGGASGLAGNASPLEAIGAGELLRQLGELGADYVLMDLPAGIGRAAVELMCGADAAVAVTVATPDAVEATYRLFCAAYLFQAGGLASGSRAREIAPRLAARPGRPPTPREARREIAEAAPELEGGLARLSASFRPLLVVNQTRIKADEALGEAMVSASVRWLGVSPRLLGDIGWDDNVWLSLRRGLPLLVEFPRSRACRDLEGIVRRLLNADARAPAAIPLATPDQNLYELLEVYPGASEEEVRRARKRIREWFGADGLAGTGACDPAELEDYSRRIEDAHATLLDRSKRREYDRRAFPDGFPSAPDRTSGRRDSIAGTVTATRDSLPDVELADDQIVDGDFLGRTRKALGVELVDICNRAKISVAYLEAIEQERFEDLPEAVFTRGFVMEFARFLKIDPQRAARDFMTKLAARRPRPGR